MKGMNLRIQLFPEAGTSCSLTCPHLLKTHLWDGEE